MKKIRFLALLLVILMVSSAFIFVACDKDKVNGDECADGEHEWKNEKNEQKRKVVQELTCTTPEIRERECKKCGKTEQYESAAATGHRYNSALKVYQQDATCTEDGHTVNHCMFYERCGSAADKVEVLVGSALGHEYVNYVSMADGYSAIAKCVRCSETSEKLLGLKLDMEGDRSHLSYQAMSVYTGGLTDAAKYEKAGDNTYLSITRPDNYLGNPLFGVILNPVAENLMGNKYIIEANFMLDKDGTGDLILFKGVKSMMNQSMTFLTYDSDTKTISGLDGAVYTLNDEDFENGIKVGLLIDDTNQIYEVFVNDKLASYRSISYQGSYFPGIPIKSIEISMEAGKTASTFGVDDIFLYTGNYPKGYNNEATDGSNSNKTYGVYTLLSGQNISYKLPVNTDQHTDCSFDESVVFEAGCVIGGYTVYTCSGCGGQKIANEVPANNHDYDGGVIVPPNCYEAGFIVYTCRVCGQKYGEQNAPMVEHEHVAGSTVVAPTCTEDGYTEGPCKYCGITFKIVDEGSALGHELGDDATYVKPTCSVDGYKTGKCVRCGANYTDPDFTIEKYGHYDFDFSEYTTVEATCVENGYEEHTCLSCGEKYHENEVTALGHRKYSKVETIEDVSYIVTRCLACDLYEKIKLGDSTQGPPSFTDVVSGIATDDQIKLWSGTENWVGTVDGFNEAEKRGNGGLFARYAKFENLTESGNSYMEVVTNGNNAAAVSNGHTYWNYGLDDTNFTTKNKSVVFEFDIRVPAGKQIINGIDPQAFNRYDGKPNGVTSISISKGKVLFAGAETSYVVGSSWVRISLVYDFENRMVTGYCNGAQLGTQSLPSYFDSMNYVRINFNAIRGQGVDQYADIDNVMLYYGDMPSYITAPSKPEPTKKLDPSDLSQFTFCSEEGLTDYLNSIMGGTKIVYKQNAAFKLVDRDADGTNDAMNYVYNSSVTSVPPYTGTDTHFTAFGFAAKSTITVRQTIKFNKATGYFSLLQGRREATGGAKFYDYVKYRYAGVDPETNSAYGYLYALDGRINIGTVYEGETIDLYVVDDGAGNRIDVYLNGELKILNGSYAYNTGYAVDYTGMTFKCFNNLNSGDLDIDIQALEFYSGMVMPDGYSGDTNTVGDKEYSFEKNPIVKFDGTEQLVHIGNVGGGENSTRVPGGYVYSTVEGKSYLSLSKNPDTVKLKGDAKYVMIDPHGNEVESGGVWTLKVGNFATNATAPVEFRSFAGVPLNPATGNYDFTAYNTMRIRVYVKDSIGFTFMGKINCPDNNGISYLNTAYVKYQGEGWHEITCGIDPATTGSRGAKWNNVVSINFEFSGWGTNGIGGNGNYDGFEIYIESITLEKNDITLADTGYTVTGGLCEEHTYGDPVVYEAENCGDVGYSYKLCSVCGYKDITVDGPKAHTLSKVEDECAEPTCDTNGVIVFSCSDCGLKFKEFIPFNVHNFVLKEDATEEEGYIAATCTEGGQDVYVCTNPGCKHAGKTFVVTTDPTGHKIIEGEGEFVEANCTDNAKYVGNCFNCGASCEIEVPGTALGHNLVTEEVPATCEGEGHIIIKCDRVGCGHVEKDEIIAPLGHIRPADYLVDIIERSCASYPGIKYNCLRCNEEVKELDESQGKDLHRWGDWVDIVAPDCGNNGSRDKICSVCDLRMSEYGTEEEKQLCIILATGNHSYDTSKYVYSSDDETIVRTKYYVCSVCGAIDPDSVIEIPATHTGTEGLIFTDNKSGKYVITGYTGTATEIFIPATYSGKPVILGNALVGNTSITSVVIADGVTVQAGAFSGCTKLANVILPSDMTVLPAEIFKDCIALKSVVLPESCATIEQGAFYGCIQLATLEVKGTLTSVKQFAFAGCDALTTVKYVVAVIPDAAIVPSGNDALYNATWVTAD